MGGGGAVRPSFPCIFAFYSKYLDATHTWKLLTLQTFFLQMSLKMKKNQIVWYPSPSENFEISVQKPPMGEGVKKYYVIGKYIT